MMAVNLRCARDFCDCLAGGSLSVLPEKNNPNQEPPALPNHQVGAILNLFEGF
jgi:hypothetical protein